MVSIEFLTFEDLGGGRSRLSAHAVYPSMEARDGMAQSGMEGGMSEGYERLEELLSRGKGLGPQGPDSKTQKYDGGRRLRREGGLPPSYLKP